MGWIVAFHPRRAQAQNGYPIKRGSVPDVLRKCDKTVADALKARPQL